MVFHYNIYVDREDFWTQTRSAQMNADKIKRLFQLYGDFRSRTEANTDSSASEEFVRVLFGQWGEHFPSDPVEPIKISEICVYLRPKTFGCGGGRATNYARALASTTIATNNSAKYNCENLYRRRAAGLSISRVRR